MIVRALGGTEERPADPVVSAVFLIAIRDDRILAIRNERGWDVPGGHVEPGESRPRLLRGRFWRRQGPRFSMPMRAVMSAIRPALI